MAVLSHYIFADVKVSYQVPLLPPPPFCHQLWGVATAKLCRVQRIFLMKNPSVDPLVSQLVECPFSRHILTLRQAIHDCSEELTADEHRPTDVFFNATRLGEVVDYFSFPDRATQEALKERAEAKRVKIDMEAFHAVTRQGVEGPPGSAGAESHMTAAGTGQTGNFANVCPNADVLVSYPGDIRVPVAFKGRQERGRTYRGHENRPLPAGTVEQNSC